MTLEIRRIAEPGVLDKERVILVARSAIDIGDYAIFQTASDGVQVFADVKNTFWLPDVLVNSKDLVVIYTKKGKESVKENQNGTTTRFLYWNLETPLWFNGKTAAVIAHISSWSAKHP